MTQYRDQADLQNVVRMERDLKLCSLLPPVSLDMLCHTTETVWVRSNFAKHKATFFFKRVFQYISRWILVMQQIREKQSSHKSKHCQPAPI